jgi:hypothetical protein
MIPVGNNNSNNNNSNANGKQLNNSLSTSVINAKQIAHNIMRKQMINQQQTVQRVSQNLKKVVNSNNINNNSNNTVRKQPPTSFSNPPISSFPINKPSTATVVAAASSNVKSPNVGTIRRQLEKNDTSMIDTLQMATPQRIQKQLSQNNLTANGVRGELSITKIPPKGSTQKTPLPTKNTALPNLSPILSKTQQIPNRPKSQSFVQPGVGSNVINNSVIGRNVIGNPVIGQSVTAVKRPTEQSYPGAIKKARSLIRSQTSSSQGSTASQNSVASE